MATRLHRACLWIIAGGSLAGLSGGCSGEFGGPPPGEAHRKEEVEASNAGAASIEELREAYESAHRKKDFKVLGDLCGTYLGPRKYWPGRELSPTQLAMREITKFKIRSVEFESAPAHKREVTYERSKGKKHYSIVGDARGKLILVMADGKRVDPSYVVLNYYGRFVIEVAQFVVVDAVQHLKTDRPCEWVAVPMDKPRRRDPDSPADAILGL